MHFHEIESKKQAEAIRIQTDMKVNVIEIWKKESSSNYIRDDEITDKHSLKFLKRKAILVNFCYFMRLVLRIKEMA